jgi:hypothetical protein
VGDYAERGVPEVHKDVEAVIFNYYSMRCMKLCF